MIQFIAGFFCGGIITWCIAWFITQRCLINPIEKLLDQIEKQT